MYEKIILENLVKQGKKINIEKVLKLLKQYWKRTFNDETLLRIYYEEKTDCFCWMYQPRPGMKLEQGQMLETPVVFSKSFGFVKRLVDNNKINFNFVKRVGSGDFTYDMESYNGCTCEDLEEYGDVDRVLMLLAIQDEPIEFLISILK